MASFVVCWDGNVDKFGGRVSVAESNDGDVDIGGFFDGLGVGPGVGEDNQAGFLERPRNVIGEVSGCEATSNGNGTGVGGEFEDSSLAVGAGGNDTDVCWVVDCSDNAGSQNDFLPTIA
jgi:hypothetical protein